MATTKKGARVEPGIWKHPDGQGYLAEINYTDPRTNRRIRERKSIHRIDLAREWRQTRQTDALRGEVRRRKDGPKPTSFKKLADEYLENWSKIEKAPSSYVRDCNSMKHIGAFFGTKLISEIKRRDIEGYVAHRKAAGPQPGTLNRELSCLRNMLRKAVDWELIESSPAWGVRKQREEVIEYEFLTEEEAERLVESCPPSRLWYWP